MCGICGCHEMIMNITVFQDVTPCQLVEIYQTFTLLYQWRLQVRQSAFSVFLTQHMALYYTHSHTVMKIKTNISTPHKLSIQKVVFLFYGRKISREICSLYCSAHSFQKFFLYAFGFWMLLAMTNSYNRDFTNNM